jgi:hypothetical protein
MIACLAKGGMALQTANETETDHDAGSCLLKLKQDQRSFWRPKKMIKTAIVCLAKGAFHVQTSNNSLMSTGIDPGFAFQ